MNNIYHCCIQKSASQWLKKIFSESLIRRRSGLVPFVPKKDFILARKNIAELENGFPLKTIVTPLYVDYDSFQTIPKPSDWRAFWVMRDPRDMMVSRYFSHRNSHPMLNSSLLKEREALRSMSMHDGLMRMIRELGERQNALLGALSSWLNAKADKRIRLFRYEDLTGPNQVVHFQSLMNHCEIQLSGRERKILLRRSSFKRLSGGRKPGEADPASHYRSGLSGDWRAHFSPAHERVFREVSGDLLKRLGYE